MIDKFFCKKCGMQCDAKKIIYEYSTYTGEPKTFDVYRCRNYRWWMCLSRFLDADTHKKSWSWNSSNVIEEQKAPK